MDVLRGTSLASTPMSTNNVDWINKTMSGDDDYPPVPPDCGLALERVHYFMLWPTLVLILTFMNSAVFFGA